MWVNFFTHLFIIFRISTDRLWFSKHENGFTLADFIIVKLYRILGGGDARFVHTISPRHVHQRHGDSLDIGESDLFGNALTVLL